ncbi:glycosyl hydrolase family 16 [Arthrobacter sp. SLBN-100]|uniref:DNRLRE domain-containing protein n=1 Tax=Arthrobacter sp. SLBN-100 TaxID=2768450 RepID=UPI001154C2F0|nr:DNRLRE domain-containing protein [Arthrobacter sp. SLBN-100]TQJ67789.1 glycosyl hydrolase family 16 [Arthrobacter sp. SLBN-100]
MFWRKCAAVASSILVGSAIITPTTASAAASVSLTMDTYVQANKPTTNFGASVRLSTEGRTNIWRNTLLRFKVQVPAGEHVVSAKLRAYSEASTTSTEFVDVFTTSGAWTESGVTWNNAPARQTWLGKKGGFANGSWVEWDVTKGVSSNGGEQNFKLESNAQKWIGFKSKESPDPALRPRLVVTTAPDAVAPAEAAVALGWGTPVTGDEFNYTGAPDAAKWDVYNSAGHAGNGIRSPQQVAVDGSKMVMTGTPDGTTAGMGAKFARQKYGRWEVRAAGSGDNEYHMVSILWPDSENWPCDGEVDYAETTGDWNLIQFFHHYGCSNSQTSASKTLDVTQFHNYAVDWSPNGIVGYVDGVKWFEDNNSAHQPPGSMHQTLQLDWFPDSTANGAGEMRVDWVRVYAAAGTA